MTRTEPTALGEVGLDLPQRRYLGFRCILAIALIAFFLLALVAVGAQLSSNEKQYPRSCEVAGSLSEGHEWQALILSSRQRVGDDGESCELTISGGVTMNVKVYDSSPTLYQQWVADRSGALLSIDETCRVVTARQSPEIVELVGEELGMSLGAGGAPTPDVLPAELETGMVASAHRWLLAQSTTC